MSDEERETWLGPLLLRGSKVEGEQARLVMEVDAVDDNGTTGDNLSNKQLDDGELRANTRFTLKLYLKQQKEHLTKIDLSSF